MAALALSYRHGTTFGGAGVTAGKNWMFQLKYVCFDLSAGSWNLTCTYGWRKGAGSLGFPKEGTRGSEERKSAHKALSQVFLLLKWDSPPKAVVFKLGCHDAPA